MSEVDILPVPQQNVTECDSSTPLLFNCDEWVKPQSSVILTSDSNSENVKYVLLIFLHRFLLNNE